MRAPPRPLLRLLASPELQPHLGGAARQAPLHHSPSTLDRRVQEARLANRDGRALRPDAGERPRWFPPSGRLPAGQVGADLQALDWLPGVLGINACNGSTAAEHVRKASEDEKVALWLRAHNRFEVWAWDLRGPATLKRWRLRRIALKLDPNGEIYSEPVEDSEDSPPALPGF